MPCGVSAIYVTDARKRYAASNVELVMEPQTTQLNYANALTTDHQ